MKNYMEPFFYRVFVIYVIRHYDASLRNELYRSIMFGNRTQVKNSGCDGNPNPHEYSSFLYIDCEFRNSATGAFCKCSMCSVNI
jgi:hypothetical protein